MISLILSRLPNYQDFGVLTSAFLILPRLPFNYHNFDVQGPRSICKQNMAVMHWINALHCCHKVSPQFPMTIIKLNKLPTQGKSMQAPVPLHKPADSASL